jgi:5'-3' exoribonuclease 2
MSDCTGAARPIEGSDYAGEEEKVFGEETKFIWVRLSVLREYLRRDLQMPNLPFPYDFERAVDDWVFMCFFVGNDFLPHLPSLEIREGAIDRLVRLYKDAVYNTGVSINRCANDVILYPIRSCCPICSSLRKEGE